MYTLSMCVTGLWLGYTGLRYGLDQVIAKFTREPWKMACQEKNIRRKKWLRLFFSL